MKKDVFEYTIPEGFEAEIKDGKVIVRKADSEDERIRKDIATFIFNYRGDIKDRAKWMDYLGIKVSLVEKQCKQKSVEWSEEDESHKNFILELLRSLKNKLPEFADQYQAAYDWFKARI